MTAETVVGALNVAWKRGMNMYPPNIRIYGHLPAQMQRWPCSPWWEVFLPENWTSIWICCLHWGTLGKPNHCWGTANSLTCNSDNIHNSTGTR
jgi:hypothetical protein